MRSGINNYLLVLSFIYECFEWQLSVRYCATEIMMKKCSLASASLPEAYNSVGTPTLGRHTESCVVELESLWRDCYQPIH